MYCYLVPSYKERLTVHNAELCDRLAATQHSRTVLEREVLSLKRKLLEEKTVNGRLDQLLLSSDRERTAMKEQMKQLVSADQSNSDAEALRNEKVFHIKTFYSYIYCSTTLNVRI